MGVGWGVVDETRLAHVEIVQVGWWGIGLQHFILSHFVGV